MPVVIGLATFSRREQSGSQETRRESIASEIPGFLASRFHPLSESSCKARDLMRC
jgi:hypothetical protein